MYKYFKFLLNLWIIKQVTAEQIDTAVIKGYLTPLEAKRIKETEQFHM